MVTLFRLFIFIIIVISIVYMTQCACEYRSTTQNDLRLVFKAYHEEVASTSALTAITLMKPFLEDENRGRFLQRLDFLNEGYGHSTGFFIPKDSYSRIIWDLTDECADNEPIYRVIVGLNRELDGIRELRLALSDPKYKPSVTNLGELKKEFQIIRERIDASLEKIFGELSH